MHVGWCGMGALHNSGQRLADRRSTAISSAGETFDVQENVAHIQSFTELTPRQYPGKGHRLFCTAISSVGERLVCM